jgi:hypothetical protein
MKAVPERKSIEVEAQEGLDALTRAAKKAAERLQAMQFAQSEPDTAESLLRKVQYRRDPF